MMGRTVQAQDVTNGYVIAVEGEKVYIDLAAGKVQPGDKVTVYSKERYFVHPVTKKQLKREPSQIALLEITKVYDDYSLASAIPAQNLSKIEVGMTVQYQIIPHEKTIVPQNDTYSQPSTLESFSSYLSTESTRKTDNKVSVFVAPAQVNDVVSIGYFGSYVSDLLMEQLMFCEKVRLLDRTVLGMQMDETNLTGNYIDPNTAIQKGKIAGAQYVIQVTMQKPDVVNIKTGIPLASIMGAIQSGVGKNIGAQYMSNMEVGILTASVSITARVVDLQTSEVLFMSSGTGKAKGKSQLSMEYGALGGAQLNGGAEGFKQTVTGQAIQKAFIGIGRNLNQYFNGDAKTRVMGSASGFGNYGDKMRVRGMSIYMGTEKLSADDVRSIFFDQPEMYFKYKKAKKQNNWSWLMMSLGVAGAGLTAFLYKADNVDLNGYNGELIPLIAGTGLLTGGIIMQINARKKIKNIANIYNLNIRKQRMASYDLSLVTPVTGGLGLRVTF